MENEKKDKCLMHDKELTHRFCGECMKDIYFKFDELRISKKLTAKLTDKCRDYEIKIRELEGKLY